MFVKEKKWGQRERKRWPDQEVVNRSQHWATDRSQKKIKFVGFLETNLQKKRLILPEFRRKIRDQFCRKIKVKKATILCQLFFFWGGGEDCWALACTITTTTETSTTYKLKCCLFRTAHFMFKAPICFAISFGLGIVLHKVFLMRDLHLLF